MPWLPVGLAVAVLAMVGLLLMGSPAMCLRGRLDTLERLQRLLQQQLAIDQALEDARQRLHQRDRALREQARLLERWEAALDALDAATADGDPQQVHACQRRVERAREAYHELATGHVHTDTEGSSPTA
jgi:Tfp pilus assembly protein PilN